MDELLIGVSLGLGAGLAPGPLTALLVSATARRGFPAGARVALAPLVTDVPVVLLCVLVLDALPERALGGLGLAGGLFVVWLGVEAFREGDGDDGASAAGGAARPAGDLRRGALVNALSPHPWLFWLGAGGPLLVGAGGALPAGAFLAGFYVLLVGTKLALAGLVARVGRRPGTARVAAVLLVGAGLVLVADGVRTVAGG